MTIRFEVKVYLPDGRLFSHDHFALNAGPPLVRDFSHGCEVAVNEHEMLSGYEIRPHIRVPWNLLPERPTEPS